MPDLLHLLADLGHRSITTIWAPIAWWTLLAFVAESGLRIVRAHAMIGLPVRGAVLASLPVFLVLAAVALTLGPHTASGVASLAPTLLVRLPEIVVGGADPSGAVGAGPQATEVLLGLLLVLALGLALWGLFRLCVEGAHLHRLRSNLPLAAPPVQERLERARRRLRLTRETTAVVVPRGTVPFTIGWRRPLIAIPADLVGPELDAVLTHELAHIKRGDFAWNVAQRTVIALFGAHPVVHILGRGLDLDRERAADAVVLTAHPESRVSYADLLLSYASLPPPPFALAAAPGASSLKSRIDAMTRPLPSDRLRHLGRTLGTLTLVLGAGLAVLAAAPASAERNGVTPVTNAALERVVEGVVVDADSREPIPMASLQVVGTSIGAATDLDGRYRMDVPDGDLTIRVSATDYDSRTVRLAADQDELDVALTIKDAISPNRVTSTERPGYPDVLEVSEVQPTLIGGLDGLLERVVYPQEARDEGVQGQVLIQFIVGQDGSVQDAVVLRSPDDRLSEAALTAVRGSRFELGRQLGEPVRVRFAVPITFQLPSGGGQD